MHIDLREKVALVTGAATGIGCGIARALAAAGAHVIVNDIDSPRGMRVVEEILSRGYQGSYMHADIADDAAVRDMASRIARQHPGLHILVNNAGIASFKGIAATEPEDWDRVMAVDLRGIYLVTRACLPLLEAAAPASVVSIASVHAQLTVGTMTAYAAAKGAVVAMIRSLAQELGPKGIRVNAVSPGFVDTPLFQSWLRAEHDPPEALARVNDIIPLGRIASVDDVGNLVTFLSSDKANSITGANYVIDGGLTTRLMH